MSCFEKQHNREPATCGKLWIARLIMRRIGPKRVFAGDKRCGDKAFMNATFNRTVSAD